MADLAPSAAGHAAAAGAQVRRLVAAGDARHRVRRGLLGGAAARSGAVQRPQPARDRGRRGGAAALRRQVPADHGVRRPRGARGARPHADGRRPLAERRQPHHSRWRREDRRHRLLRHHQQHDRGSGADRRRAGEGRRRRAGPGAGSRHRPGRGRRPDPAERRAHRRPALRVRAGAQAGQREHHRGRGRGTGAAAEARRPAARA